MKIAKSGLTLIELLVVIVILLVLTGLSMSGIGAIRNRMNATICQNNLRQLGLGLASFESTHGYIPGGKGFGYSTFVTLLPFLELENLHDSIDFEKTPSHPVNLHLHRARPSFLVCPLNNVHPNGSDTSYLTCRGTTSLFGDGPGVFSPGPGNSSLHHITDGLSNTIAMTEFSRGTPSNRIRKISTEVTALTVSEFDRLLAESLAYQDDSEIGVEWMLNGKSNSFYKHYATPGSKSGTVVGGSVRHAAFTPSSNHPNLTHILKADGSVSSASYSIDRNLWLQLGHRSDGGIDFLKTYK